jgi:hypothetical protein
MIHQALLQSSINALNYNNEYNIESKKKSKKISFNHIISAVLIPCNKDMDAEMRSQLWWNNADYINFYIASRAEIDFFLKMHSDLNRKDASRLLYQHSMICYEPYMM